MNIRWGTSASGAATILNHLSACRQRYEAVESGGTAIPREVREGREGAQGRRDQRDRGAQLWVQNQGRKLG